MTPPGTPALLADRLAAAEAPTFRDRRRDRSALHESEGWLRRGLLMLPEPMLVHTAGRIGFANEAAQRLFGMGESDLVGRAPLSLVHPASHDAVAEWTARLVGRRTVPATHGSPVQPRAGPPRGDANRRCAPVPPARIRAQPRNRP